MVIYDFILPPRKLKPDTFPESMAVPSRDGAAHRPQGKTNVRGHTPSAAPARSPGARRSAREQLQRFPGARTPPPPGKPWGGSGKARDSLAVERQPYRVLEQPRGAREGRKKGKNLTGLLCTPPCRCIRKTERAARGKGEEAGTGADSPASALTTAGGRRPSSLRPRGIPRSPGPRRRGRAAGQPLQREQ